MSEQLPFVDLVDMAAEESAQALFSPAAEVAPVGQIDELLAALQGPALRAVLHQAAVLQPGTAQAATHLKVARRKLVRGAALALAGIQRIDLEMERQADV